MMDIFKKLAEYFKPNQEREINVIGFYTHTNDLFIYNGYDDRFDDWLKVDLSDSAFKYENTTMQEAEICMQIEGCVGDLENLSLFI